MTAHLRCRNCGSITEVGRFCQVCGASLAEPVSQVPDLTRQLSELERQFEKANSERRAIAAQKDDLQHELERAKNDLKTEIRRHEAMETELERLKVALTTAEARKRKTLDEVAAEVYEYLASHRGEIDPLQCAGELHISEREIIESLDLLQRQRKIERT